MGLNAMRMTLLLTFAALTTGCTTAQWNEMRANPREYFNLIEPTLQTDARIDGQRITLHRWQALVVRLDEDASSGQRWEMQPIAASTVIAPVQHDFVAKPGTAPAPEAISGEAVFRLRGVAAGTQPVVLEFKRPLEPASKTIRFDVDVR
jgi:predicted secreted protein